ncbi:MAG: acyltransferase [Bacteroidaceae bacterium]|nr:acyltransferase [Bacteroidaceae bacterium]
MKLFFACKWIYLQLSHLWNLFFFRMAGVKLGKHAQLKGRIGIYNNGQISIGDYFDCYGGSMVNTIGKNINSFLVSGKGATLQIGNHVGISSSTIKADNKIIIEDYVMIGADSVVIDTDSHPVDASLRHSANPANAIVTKPIIIRKNAFIGARCYICKGVEIGENAVIGACSVVTKNVPANEIWAGNPAHFIKKIETEK